jgi:hypothetical protein
MSQSSAEAQPEQPIRRFDVFAEFTRQERLAKGDAPDEAKGYGIWLAKVVASRRFGAASSADRPAGAHRRAAETEHPKFRSVGDELQTDAVFDHDIIQRMGRGFYDQVFTPAIEEARSNGQDYKAIRDAIRKQWKPPTPTR